MPLPDLGKLPDSAVVFDPANGVTRAFNDFCYQCTRIVEPLIYLSAKFDWLEKASINAARVLRKIDAENNASHSKGEPVDVGHFREFQQRVPVLAQNSIVSLVDAFDTYISDLIIEILSQNPKMLSLKKTITVEEVLNAGDIATLVNRQVLRRARELSFLSFHDKVRVFQKEYSFGLVDDEMVTLLSRITSLRNCFVHNRGRLDDKACYLIGSDAQVGMKVIVQGEDVFDLAGLLDVVVEDIDKRAAQKFKLSPSAKDTACSGSIELCKAVGLPALGSV